MRSIVSMPGLVFVLMAATYVCVQGHPGRHDVPCLVEDVNGKILCEVSCSTGQACNETRRGPQLAGATVTVCSRPGRPPTNDCTNLVCTNDKECVTVNNRSWCRSKVCSTTAECTVPGNACRQSPYNSMGKVCRWGIGMLCTDNNVICPVGTACSTWTRGRAGRRPGPPGGDWRRGRGRGHGHGRGRRQANEVKVCEPEPCSQNISCQENFICVNDRRASGCKCRPKSPHKCQNVIMTKEAGCTAEAPVTTPRGIP